MAVTVLSEKGQVVIPAEIRARLGLQRGDRFDVEIRDDGLLFRLLPRNPLLELEGAFAGRDSLVDALLEERRHERQREDRRADG